ncbi:hypothetical protein QJS04_geneDACA021306 [Acorus gramineus]|uniref:Uncharacterized protein n=1 Tax=Acorus gramineus TaxID=55184 RepID=A0AAV9AN65_ACOGR|nr:hypothetical protein QJS04_geneDACA021306 [Acorus gramineus]
MGANDCETLGCGEEGTEKITCQSEEMHRGSLCSVRSSICDESEGTKEAVCQSKEISASASCHLGPSEDCSIAEESRNAMNATDSERLERGHLLYGCHHYRRRCRIRAPCCNEIFDCRHCHNEAKELDCCHTLLIEACITAGSLASDYLTHTLLTPMSPVVALLGGGGSYVLSVAPSRRHRKNSTIAMGVEFAGCCYSVLLKNSHSCVERAMHHDCPVCFEYLFESTNDVSVLPCGHTIHVKCLKEMQQHLQYACPLCSKSVCDMSKVWEMMDMEVAATPIPEVYQNRMHIIFPSTAE